jgi:hypothetical protein
VVQILFSEVLDPKIIYYEYKLDVSGFVLPKSGHNLALEVPFEMRQWQRRKRAIVMKAD